jgi:hypothetical protein
VRVSSNCAGAGPGRVGLINLILMGGRKPDVTIWDKDFALATERMYEGGLTHAAEIALPIHQCAATLRLETPYNVRPDNQMLVFSR